MRILLYVFSSSITFFAFLLIIPTFLSPKALALSMVPINTSIKLPAVASFMPLSKPQQAYIQEVKVIVESKTTQPATIITPPPPQIPTPTPAETIPSVIPQISSIALHRQAEIVRTAGDTIISSVKLESTATPTPSVLAVTPSAPTVAQTAQTPVEEQPQLNGDLLFDMVNQYRVSLGLAPYEKEEKLCVLAEARANEAYNEIWVTNTMHSGLRNRNLPHRIWENLISQNSESQALIWWQNSYIHNQGLTSDMKYACCKCNGKSCSLLITDYASK